VLILISRTGLMHNNIYNKCKIQLEDNLSKAKVAIQIQEKFIIYLNKTILNKKKINLIKFCRKETKIKDAL